MLIAHVLSHYIVNSKGCRCVPAKCRYFSGKMSLKVRANVAIWAVYAQSEQAYWALKVRTFSTLFCKTFLLTNTTNSRNSNTSSMKVCLIVQTSL